MTAARMLADLAWRLTSRTWVADQIRRRWWLWLAIWAVATPYLAYVPSWATVPNELEVVADFPGRLSWKEAGHPVRPGM